ncbi:MULTISPECIES: OmpP1/FadL family transporter [unclassified Pseudomonas]|jgi:long-chain fatty acid transport protein|uniref:OmpP1/FadL family transporter n=1 Tax=unclassified Pseudomonas TaxID=196821 RepID=UPI0015A0C6E1|nr:MULTISPECIES: outer membrane protein transport protein [unclassified Pseudomonas]MDQ0666490.1 long-chain fatty acid transport protein [Pseudomonas sp. W2I6]NVZ14679.1 outer membrane protein transport protein [Pseudomonas sp. IPO3775]NVZ39530.1 outer membrane protein transport protein [Pseudomonas sp. 21615526]NVZ96952.1 outer membrane protein transport protein [Pseudomonas sp. B6001]NWA32538.1 outer membrane protein transport protein [Pseudomonas sp. C6002]
MKKVMLKTTLSLAVAMASSHVFASGFALNEQDVAGMGTGFAGRSSSAENASTVYGNPAGMARLEGQQVTGGVAAIDASTNIKDVSGRSSGSNKGDMVPFTAVPFGFYTNKLNEQWAVGFGVYAPFGLVTDYESGFQGKAFGSKSEVKVITFQPTVSYAFNDRVSIGFGPTINRIAGTLESDINLPIAGTGSNNVKIKGDDTALGFNAGLLVQATDTTRVGLTYHSKVKYKLEGHTEVTKGANVPASLLNNGRYDASLKIDTPESWDLSVTQDLSDAWKLYAGATWTRWSRLKDITVNNEGVSAAAGSGALAPQIVGTIKEDQNWHDTWAYALGTSYRVTKQVVLRTGLTFDQSPTNNTDRSPRIPTGDRTIFSLGLGYDVMPNMTVDLAYSYLKEEPVKVARANALGQSYNAKYENSANGFGLGVTYKF